MKRELAIGVIATVAIVAAYCQGRASVPEPLVPMPRIVTRYDTIPSIQYDTTWRTRVVREARTDSFRVVERVTVTVIETVLVPATWTGMQFVSVPQERGDSMLIEGTTMIRDTAGTLTQRRWRAQYWTAGPLRLLAADTVPPRVAFWPPPTVRRPSRCGASATAGYAVLGQRLDAVVGFGCRLELPVLPWPF